MCGQKNGHHARDRMLKERLHSRKITVDTFEIGDKTILVEGSLRDERFFASKLHTPKGMVDPRIIHGMIVRMTLSLPSLKIISIEAEMPVIPFPECSEIKDALQKLKDMEIKHGFSDEVQRRFGKTQGCLHMMNLVLAMGSAAVQGMWSYFARIRPVEQVRTTAVHDSIVLDSCWVWRKDGPLAKGKKEKAS
jgi:hypothetical protein